jgi:hypothetical protein
MQLQSKKIIRTFCLIIFLNLFFQPVFSQTYLSEGFNGFAIPGSWQVQNQGSGPCFWTIGTPDNHTMLGSNFLYVNSNNGFGTIANEIITSPVITAPTSGVVKFRFRHHYRDNPNSPSDTGFVEVFNGTYWIKLKAYSTNIGHEDNPGLVELDLSPYLNPNLQIRFRYIGQFSYYWLIDDVKVYAAPPADLGVTVLRNVENACAVESRFFPSVTIRNFGTQAQSNFPVSFRASNLPALTETFSGTLAPGDSANHLFSVPFNLGIHGKIKFKSWTSLPGDVETGNDTASATNFILLPSFDRVDFNGYDGGNLEQISPGWEEAVGEINPQPPYSNWSRSTDTQVEALGSKTARINLYTTFARSWMFSQPFLVNNGDYFLRFKVAVTDYLTGEIDSMGNDDALVVRVSTNCGQSWTDLQAYTAASEIGNQLENKAISLSQFSGQTLRIAFFATDGFSDDPNDYDFHLDDIRVSQVFPTDFNMAELILPPDKCGLPASFPIKIKVVNNGSSPQTSMPASFQVQGMAPVSQIFPISLAPGADTILQFSTLPSIPNPGDYRISAWTSLADEGNPFDDSVKLKPFFRARSGFEIQQFTDFFGSNLGNRWEEALGLAATGQTSSWTSADPSQISTFGTETARVSLYSNFVKSWLLSPPFKPGINMDLRFKIALTEGMGPSNGTLGSDDSLIVKITTDCGQSWQKLRHYTAATSLTNQLFDQTISLASFAGQTVRIGFYATDGAIDNINDIDLHLDDIRLATNSPTDLELTAISFPTGNCGVEQQFPVKVKVVNAGTLAQNSLPLFYQIQGQQVVSQVFPVTLLPGADTILQFSALTNITIPGNYQISAWVALPGDQNQVGDSIKAIPFYRVGQTFSLQNFTGFDGSNLTLGWEEKNGFSGNLQNGSFWTISNNEQSNWLGSETARVNILGAGRREWLLSPAFSPVTGKALRFKLAMTNWASNQADEMGLDDSLIVKISSDCGQSWQNLKSFTKANQLENQFSTQDISLATYTGQTLRIAFYATAGTQWDTQDYDLHVDQVELIDVRPHDLGITAFVFPPLNCGVPDSLPVKVKIGNLGSAPQSGFTVSYSLNGSTPITQPFQGSIMPLQQQEFQFTVPVLLVPGSTYVIRAWTNLTTDEDVSNDTLNSPLLSPANQLSPVSFTGYNGENLFTLFPGWEEMTGTSPSGASSLWTSSNTSQTSWFGTVTARIPLSGNSRREWLISPSFIPSTESEIRFRLALTERSYTVSDNMGSDDSLKVLISTNCGKNWSLLRTFTALNGLSNLLAPYTADISSFGGQNCRIAFQATDGFIDNLENYDLHLDSIQTGPLTVSVLREVRQKDFSIYPNPCNADKLYVKTSSEEGNIRFFSASGTEYFPSLISKENGCYDVRSMPPGFYFVRRKSTAVPFVLIR